METRPATAARQPSCVAVWAPWLAAPLFALLPIAGCGLAGVGRPATAGPPAPPAAVAAPPATVVTVVTASDPRVAPGRAAD